MTRSRRTLLAAFGAAIAAPLAGCSSDAPDEITDTPSDGESPDPETGIETRSSTPTGTPMSSPTRSPTPTSTATPTPVRAAAGVLPDPDSDWETEDTGPLQVRYIGGESGASAQYTGPDGVTYRVIVVEWADGDGAATKAHGLYCDGWPVTVASGRFAFAAGSGTVQPTETYTPETPPHMTRSPVPETDDRAVELLSFSPVLTDEALADRVRECEWESGVRD